MEEIEAYIAADDPVAAARWVDRLMERAHKAAWVPFSGRVVPELGRENIREVLLRTYRIVYRMEGSEVQVLTVFEGHRRARALKISRNRLILNALEREVAGRSGWSEGFFERLGEVDEATGLAAAEWPDDFRSCLGAWSEEIARPRQAALSKLKDPFE